MKSILLMLVMVIPSLSFSQDGFKFIEVSATEEYPGIPSAPVVKRTIYYYEAVDDDLTVRAINNNSDSVLVEQKFKKGDKLALQFVTYSYRYDSYTDRSLVYEEPFFIDDDSGIVSMVLTNYDYNDIQTTITRPYYTLEDQLFEFYLPEVNEESIKRIFLP